MGKPGIEPGTSAYLTVILENSLIIGIQAPQKDLNPHHSQL